MREDTLISALEAFPVNAYIEAVRRAGRREIDRSVRLAASNVYAMASSVLAEEGRQLSREVEDTLDLVRRALFGEDFLLKSGEPPTPKYEAYAQIPVLNWVLRASDRRLDGVGLRSWRAIRVLVSDLFAFETSSLADGIDWQRAKFIRKVVKKRIKRIRELQRKITAVAPQSALLSTEDTPGQWQVYATDSSRMLALVFLTAFPQTREHDEYLFLRTIHISECCFWGILASVTAAMESIRQGHIDVAIKLLKEARGFSKFLVPLFQTFKTMPPEHFRRFRDATGNASAVQSRSYQLVQIFTQGVDPQKRDVMNKTPELVDLIRRFGGDEFESLKTLLGNMKAKGGGAFKGLFSVAEDLDKDLYQWRALHLGIAKQYLGDVIGTGSTDGAAYLESHYRHKIFPLE